MGQKSVHKCITPFSLGGFLLIRSAGLHAQGVLLGQCAQSCEGTGQSGGSVDRSGRGWESARAVRLLGLVQAEEEKRRGAQRKGEKHGAREKCQRSAQDTDQGMRGQTEEMETEVPAFGYKAV